MSRYEKINYDELEMLAANGGIDQNADLAITYRKVCTYNYCNVSKKVSNVSKWVTKNVCPTLSEWFCNIDPIDPPIDIQPIN